MSEQLEMDALAYSSRMLGWSPLGKLFLVIMVLIANLLTDSMIVPFITLAIGLALMAYSTNFKIPFIIAIALAEAALILIIGAGVLSVNGDLETEAIWDTQILWVHIHMTVESFNRAWLILFRGVAGMAVMMGFATSTPIPHLSQALKQIRIPDEITEIVVLIYRYAFLLLERMEAMWNAASSRMGFNGFKRTMSTVASIAVGIFISSTSMSDKAQVALECRNYRGYFPVYNAPPRMGWKWLVGTIALVVVIYVIGIYTSDWINMYEILLG